jgi:hypothetical protein
VSADGVQELLAVKLEMPQRAEAQRLTLTAELVDANGKTQNSWNLWVFPTNLLVEASHKVRSSGFDALRKIYPWALEQTPNPVPADTDLLVTTHLGQDTVDYLKAKRSRLLLEPERRSRGRPTSASSWDGGGPRAQSSTPSTPRCGSMPSDGWCDLQFYPLIPGSKTVLLDSLPVKIQPLVRCIVDRPTRLAERSLSLRSVRRAGASSW